MKLTEAEIKALVEMVAAGLCTCRECRADTEHMLALAQMIDHRFARVMGYTPQGRAVYGLAPMGWKRHAAMHGGDHTIN
jgi:hypothetical protein